MYKILIKTCTARNNIWNFYQENEADYVAASLEDLKPTALTLLKQYGKKNIRISIEFNPNIITLNEIKKIEDKFNL